MPTRFDARARSLRLLLFDVDGVLTDGTVVSWRRNGVEDVLHTRRRGAGVGAARRAAGRLAERPASGATTRRAAELGISHRGAGRDEQAGGVRRDPGGAGPHRDEQVAYMGDDLLDLPVLARVGLVGRAGRRGRRSARAGALGQPAAGGRGAVREFIEMVLRARGRWDALVALVHD